MRYLIVLLISILSSCNFTPDFSEPEIVFTDNWEMESEIANHNSLEENWWYHLGGETLRELVEEGVKYNHDVQIALRNIEKSYLLHNISNSDLLPDLDYVFSADKIEYSDRISSSQKTNYINNYLDFAWEIDLFGKLRNDRKAALYEYLSDVETERAVALSVSSEIVQNYIELRSFQKLEKITIKNISLLEDTVKLTKIRENLGIASNFDVARAYSQKELIEATLPNIRAEILSRIYALSALVGKHPLYLKVKLTNYEELNEITDPINVGLPSEILKRRPDIKSAEQLMLARNAEIGSAFADFFPSVSLTGSAGSTARKFSDLFSSSSANWQYGLDLNLPIFRAGELIDNYKISKEDKKIAILNYQKIVLNAFEEVQTSLTKYAAEVRTRDRLRRAVDNNKEIVKLSENRYQAGVDDLLAVIDAKRSLINVENSLIESETQVLLNLTDLFKALGGEV